MKRLLICLALLFAPCVALANHDYEATGTLANAATLTSGGVECERATVVTFGAAFTAAAVGTAKVSLETSFDGSTWFAVGFYDHTTATGANANYVVRSFAAQSITQPGGDADLPGVPGKYIRAKLLNSTGGNITAGYVFVIAN